MSDERMCPILFQRGAEAHPCKIPWSVAERAYSVYAARFGQSQSLERLAKRGGFSPGEMDAFLPGWREEVSEIADLRQRLAEAESRAASEYARGVEEAAREMRPILRSMISRGEAHRLIMALLPSASTEGRGLTAEERQAYREIKGRLFTPASTEGRCPVVERLRRENPGMSFECSDHARHSGGTGRVDGGES